MPAFASPRNHTPHLTREGVVVRPGLVGGHSEYRRCRGHRESVSLGVSRTVAPCRRGVAAGVRRGAPGWRRSALTSHSLPLPPVHRVALAVGSWSPAVAQIVPCCVPRTGSAATNSAAPGSAGADRWPRPVLVASNPIMQAALTQAHPSAVAATIVRLARTKAIARKRNSAGYGRCRPLGRPASL